MLNIKDCSVAYPKTFKNVLDYDEHSEKYKTNDLIIKDDQIHNFCLVDNTAKFEQSLKQYHKDLYFANKQEYHKNRKKTNAQIEKNFYQTKIMKTFRIQVNALELNKINQGISDPEKIRQNTISFYQKTMKLAVRILNKENAQKRQPLMVVKADVHFDQTNPHIHIHLSNLYEKKVKENYKDQEHKKLVITNNVEQSDLIKRLSFMSRRYEVNNNIKISPNELFTRLLNHENGQKYAFVNKIDLKAMYPKYYNIYELMNPKRALNSELKMNPKTYSKMQVSLAKSSYWSQDKKQYFHHIGNVLLKLGLIDETNQENKIFKGRLFNELVDYCFHMQMRLNLQALKIEDEGLVQKLMQDENLFKLTILQRDKVIQPNELIFKLQQQDFNLSQFDKRFSKLDQYFQNLSVHELKQKLQVEYDLVQAQKLLDEKMQNFEKFKWSQIADDLDKQGEYLKEMVSLLNHSQSLGFENTLNLISLKHDLNFSADKKLSLIQNYNFFISLIETKNDNFKESIHQDLMSALNLSFQLQMHSQSLNDYKLEKTLLHQTQSVSNPSIYVDWTNEQVQTSLNQLKEQTKLNINQAKSLTNEIAELYDESLKLEMQNKLEASKKLDAKQDELWNQVHKLNEETKHLQVQQLALEQEQTLRQENENKLQNQKEQQNQIQDLKLSQQDYENKRNEARQLTNQIAELYEKSLAYELSNNLEMSKQLDEQQEELWKQVDEINLELKQFQNQQTEIEQIFEQENLLEEPHLNQNNNNDDFEEVMAQMFVSVINEHWNQDYEVQQNYQKLSKLRAIEKHWLEEQQKMLHPEMQHIWDKGFKMKM